jgi:S-formylglutathione hydrolase
MRVISENRCFGGVQGVYAHDSATCGVEMTFGLFLPPAATAGPVPVLWYLSGLTCTHENAMVKAGLQAHAAAAGIAVVFPDTSPRGEGVADDAAYDLGQGAGFYVNATRAPWAPHFAMWDHVAEELPRVVTRNFAVDEGRQAITGHSMGGHGALTLAMGLPGRFRAVSAFAPICNPVASDWGRKQFTAYLGEDETAWGPHDATVLMRERGFDGPLLVDTGTQDQFSDKLGTAAFAAAVAARRQEAVIRLQRGYDHSYFFVASFAAEHVAFHARALA